MKVLSPRTGRSLTPDGEGVLTDGTDHWPVIDGIPYLRAGRDPLVAECVGLLRHGEARRALILLLRDQDDFATTPPPDEDAVADLLDDPATTFRDAMAALAYGRVADYFAHRWSAPTFLSGLSLMGLVARDGRPLIEVACGTGQLLAEAARHGVSTAGIDVVFSKAWLGKHYVSPQSLFVVADAVVSEHAVVDAGGPASVFCHDAFYFFPDKPRALAGMADLSRGGAVAIGHAHTPADDTGVAGSPIGPEATAAMLLSGAVFFDDRDLTTALLEGMPPRAKPVSALLDAGAIAFMTRAPEGWVDFSVLPPATPLRVNPLLRQKDEGGWEPDWPHPSFAHEYRMADYLSATDGRLAALAEAGPAARRDAVRRRHLLALPERW